MSGAWVRETRRGRLPNPVPFPAPDGQIRQKNRVIHLWRRERLAEFEDWYRAHVRALADVQIAAMEENVRRMRGATL